MVYYVGIKIIYIWEPWNTLSEKIKLRVIDGAWGIKELVVGQPVFDPYDSHGGRKELALESILWPPYMYHDTCVQTHIPTHNNNIR